MGRRRPGTARVDGVAVERIDAVRVGRRARVPAGAWSRLAAAPGPAPLDVRAADDRADHARAARPRADPGAGAAARDQRPARAMAGADHAPEHERRPAPARV